MPASVHGALAIRRAARAIVLTDNRVGRDVAVREILLERAAHELAVVAGVKPGAAPNSTSTDSSPRGLPLDRVDAHRRAQIGLDAVEMNQPLGGVGNHRPHDRHLQRLLGLGPPLADFAEHLTRVAPLR